MFKTETLKTYYNNGKKYTLVKYGNGDVVKFINYCNGEIIAKQEDKMLTFNECKTDNRFLRLSEGNAKLKPTKNIKFLIWNLPAIATCPFANDCKKFCYARKAEKVYPSVLPARQDNYNRTLENDFIKNMIFTISASFIRSISSSSLLGMSV